MMDEEFWYRSNPRKFFVLLGISIKANNPDKGTGKAAAGAPNDTTDNVVCIDDVPGWD